MSLYNLQSICVETGNENTYVNMSSQLFWKGGKKGVGAFD